MAYLINNFLFVVGKIILWFAGWQVDGQAKVTNLSQCVVIASPHTSNWDIVFTRAAFAVMRFPVRFTIKREWIKTPLGLVLLFLGAIPIDRRPKDQQSKARSMVEAMSDLFEKYKELAVLVTPEGTRSKVTEWRTGFYHIAKMANVPIALGYLDYKKKTAGIGKVIYPSDIETDLREIMAFYAQIAPKFPEKFSVDLRYS